MFKFKIKYLLPLCLSMVFLLSFCLIVNAETCTSCNGLGYVMSYSNYKEKCSYCSGTTLVWQDEVTEEQPCYNCHDGIIYLYFDCTVCNAERKIKAQKKALMDEKKQALRTDDISRGVFVPVNQLPVKEPKIATAAV